MRAGIGNIQHHRRQLVAEIVGDAAGNDFEIFQTRHLMQEILLRLLLPQRYGYGRDGRGLVSDRHDEIQEAIVGIADGADSPAAGTIGSTRRHELRPSHRCTANLSHPG